MYAIISDGAHQYRVEEGTVFDVERKDVADDSTTIEFDRILMVGDYPNGPKIGRPVVAGAKVVASLMGEHKAPKVEIRKFSRRKGYSLHKGHRQKYLKVKVETIEA